MLPRAEEASRRQPRIVRDTFSVSPLRVKLDEYRNGTHHCELHGVIPSGIVASDQELATPKFLNIFCNSASEPTVCRRTRRTASNISGGKLSKGNFAAIFARTKGCFLGLSIALPVLIFDPNLRAKSTLSPEASIPQSCIDDFMASTARPFAPLNSAHSKSHENSIPPI